MHPLLIIGGAKALKDWWNGPSWSERKAGKEAANQIRARMEWVEYRCKLHSAKVSPAANAAYKKGMSYWQGGMFTMRNKEKARHYIRIAAQGGHLDAQSMARMHGIDF